MSKNKRLKKKREKSKEHEIQNNAAVKAIEIKAGKKAQDPESAPDEGIRKPCPADRDQDSVIREEKENTVHPAAKGQEEDQHQDQTADKPLEEAAVKRKRTWKKAAGIAGGAAALILVGIYIGGIVYFQDKFFVNTSINGIDASYSTVEDIEAILAGQLRKYEIQLKERGGGREKITADQIRYHYVSRGEVQGFMKEQKAYTWPVCFWSEYSYRFTSSTEFDGELLEKTVGGLKCFSPGVEKEPKDAYMEFQDTTYGIVREDEGKKVRKKKLLKVLKKAIGASEKSVDLEKQSCYEQPKVRKEDENLNQLVNSLNAYARTSITYKFGENQEVLDGTLIKDWLSFDEAGNVTLDEGEIPAYVAGLAEKYDSYNKARHFQTHDGSFVDVEGGRYGWKIDQEAESAELLELVKQGTRAERTAIFAQTAVSWENSDLGHSYVEIDLTNQHLWMYVDGIVTVSSDFVSGDMSRGNRRTPPGTFTLYYKKSPSVLRSTTPGDSYETPVTYWMPFNGGIGLHDANWRGSFGGSIYQWNGSHGCINLPTGAASEIYQQIYAGYPVICYYR